MRTTTPPLPSDPAAEAEKAKREHEQYLQDVIRFYRDSSQIDPGVTWKLDRDDNDPARVAAEKSKEEKKGVDAAADPSGASLTMSSFDPTKLLEPGVYKQMRNGKETGVRMEIAKDKDTGTKTFTRTPPAAARLSLFNIPLTGDYKSGDPERVEVNVEIVGPLILGFVLAFPVAVLALPLTVAILAGIKEDIKPIVQAFSDTLDCMKSQGVTSIYIDWGSDPSTGRCLVHRGALDALLQLAEEKGLSVTYGPEVKRFLNTLSQADQTKYAAILTRLSLNKERTDTIINLSDKAHLNAAKKGIATSEKLLSTTLDTSKAYDDYEAAKAQINSNTSLSPAAKQAKITAEKNKLANQIAPAKALAKASDDYEKAKIRIKNDTTIKSDVARQAQLIDEKSKFAQHLAIAFPAYQAAYRAYDAEINRIKSDPKLTTVAMQRKALNKAKATLRGEIAKIEKNNALAGKSDKDKLDVIADSLKKIEARCKNMDMANGHLENKRKAYKAILDDPSILAKGELPKELQGRFKRSAEWIEKRFSGKKDELAHRLTAVESLQSRYDDIKKPMNDLLIVQREERNDLKARLKVLKAELDAIKTTQDHELNTATAALATKPTDATLLQQKKNAEEALAKTNDSLKAVDQYKGGLKKQKEQASELADFHKGMPKAIQDVKHKEDLAQAHRLRS